MKYNRYLKRDALKDYFPLPNEFSAWVSAPVRSQCMRI